MQSALGRAIQIIQGLPEFSENLREINPKFNNILVFDDLMSEATESPIISLLFTQGCLWWATNAIAILHFFGEILTLSILFSFIFSF